MSEEDLKRETEEQENVTTDSCNEEMDINNDASQEDSVESQLAAANAKIEKSHLSMGCCLLLGLL